jgi:aspartate/methionine/tyrosine aminotransferase
MARRRVDLREAAEILDTTVDAVRKRIKRGTLEGDKGEDGKVYVWLDLDQTVNPDDASLSALVEAKDETIELLRHQLEQEREANRENRRLLAAALERIPAIEAPQEATGAPEAATESGEGAPYGTSRQEAQDSLQRRHSWWRRFFGFE